MIWSIFGDGHMICLNEPLAFGSMFFLSYLDFGFF
jgi:hypothetical protein